MQKKFAENSLPSPKIFHSLMTPITMFTPNPTPSNFGRI